MRKSKYWTEFNEEINKAIRESNTKIEVLRKLGVKTLSGTSYRNIDRYASKFEINLDHFHTKPIDYKNRETGSRIRKTDLEIFTVNSTSYGVRLKKRFIELTKCKVECSVCHIDTWQGKPILLQLDHISGDSSDNRIENLRLVCPNCHSQTNTWCGKNIKRILITKECLHCKSNFTATGKKKYCSHKCVIDHKRSRSPTLAKIRGKKTDPRMKQRKVERPSKEILSTEIVTTSFLQLGKKYGVSDNAIRKWCKSYGIAVPKRKDTANLTALEFEGDSVSIPV